MNTYMKKEIIVAVDLVGRKATELNQVANQYKEEIYLEDHKGRRVSCKSLLGVLSLGVHCGEKIQIYVSQNTQHTEEIFKYLLAVIEGAKA